MKLLFYSLIFILQSVIAWKLAHYYDDLISSSSNVATYIGTNISLFALFIAISEIIRLGSTAKMILKTAEETKQSVIMLENIKKLGEISSSIPIVRNHIINKKYVAAIHYLNSILKSYFDTMDISLIKDVKSTERKNYDKLQRIIRQLETNSRNLTESDIKKMSNDLDKINLDISILSKDKEGKG